MPKTISGPIAAQMSFSSASLHCALLKILDFLCKHRIIKKMLNMHPNENILKSSYKNMYAERNNALEILNIKQFLTSLAVTYKSKKH